MSLLPLLPQWRTDMSTQPDSQISSMEGAEALPRLNGELVFEEPWEGRAFGIAVALNNQRVYQWHEFREHLVGQISSDEKAGTEAHYYDQCYAPWKDCCYSRVLLRRRSWSVGLRSMRVVSGKTMSMGTGTSTMATEVRPVCTRPTP